MIMDVRTETERRFVLGLSEEEVQILTRALGVFSGGLTTDLYMSLSDAVEEVTGGRASSWDGDYEIMRTPGGHPRVVWREDEDN